MRIPTTARGHGTHVAGIVGANGGGIKGVAPEGDLRLRTGSSAASVPRRRTSCSPRWNGRWQTACKSSTRASAAGGSGRSTRRRGLYTPGQQGRGDGGVDRQQRPGRLAPDALFAAGAPGVGAKVIGVASFDNAQRAFT